MRLLLALPLALLLTSCGQPTPEQKKAQADALIIEVGQAPEQKKDGIAVMVVVDTSGSMDGSVTDSGGTRTPKFQIARRCVAKVFDQVRTFASQHPNKEIVVGLNGFSSSSYVVLSPASIRSMNEQTISDAVQKIGSNGGTAIGDAIVEAKKSLDSLGYKHSHILTITDGENGSGRDPGEVAQAFAKLPPSQSASLYLIGFDVGTGSFQNVKNAGSLVLSASDENELMGTMKFVFGEKILAEQPE